MIGSEPTIAVDQLLAARARGRGWVTTLAEALGCGESHVTSCMAASMRWPVATMSQMMQWQPAFDLVPLVKAQARQCIVMRCGESDDGLLGALVDPFDDDVLIWAEAQADRPLHWHVCAPSDLHALLGRHELAARATDSIVQPGVDAVAAAGAGESLTLEGISEAASPVVQLVDSVLYDALKLCASDVHLEATLDGLAVKYRIDGVLDPVMQVTGVALAEQAISRLKVLAELDIAERRVPQDGSFRVVAQRREIDLRVSIMPSVHGEDAVIRVLDKQAMVTRHGRLNIESLGFAPAAAQALRTLVEAAYGMVLVTGPTGSGKTTTLYAALTEMHTGRDKIVTIEDPVEYQIPGILQIPVNDKKGLTFARGLRSILRHDPDKIMVGEIRDRETAEIAVQSALTGHLVLSTVHANSVFDVFGRFTHMGLDPYSLSSALNAIWAQRLMRINCSHCSEPCAPDLDVVRRCGVDPTSLAEFDFRRGKGCGECRGTGYRGRRAVAELLLMRDDIRELVLAKQPVRQIREAARASGTRTLFEAGLDLVSQGLTTLEEVRRVTLSA
ncbi:GspE/PulE family protein [Aquabacterium humicola]|uniref:GspE/PulE family protein n=1 Tax=Aquabacterium humicola TaxID=3237377 RepID=UPI002542EC33|nr:GspE/PulE family protein [Rubrivivax pictus]